jgi:glyoxylase I family protein
VTVDTKTTAAASIVRELTPERLHHAAWNTLDSEGTRHFYEDVLGIPLVATWAEVVDGSEYVHTFYAMQDGGALAFFEYVDEDRRATELKSPGHQAFKCSKETQDGIVARLRENGIEPRIVDHGYCFSVYVVDPNNLRLEFTVDCEGFDKIAAYKDEHAHEDLKRWLAGDHTPNNDVRPH